MIPLSSRFCFPVRDWACAAFLVWLIGLTRAQLPAAPAPLWVETKGQADEYTVYHQRQKILVYATSPRQFKPYVKELYTLQDYNVLRDAPLDHLHHHALMYGIRVNGLNFWEETSGCGVQKPIALLKQESGMNAQGLPQIMLRQLIHWVTPADAFLPDTTPVALLIEQRTLTLTVDQAQQEVALHWQSDFQVGAKTNHVTLTGANYHGLGLRFQKELDPVAAHFNSESRPDLSGNKQDVSPHKWGAVSFELPGKKATVVLFGSQDNARGHANFFTMRTPFAYLSATQGLDQEPLVYRSGDKFQLNYLITVYPEVKTVEFIQQRQRAWEAAIRTP